MESNLGINSFDTGQLMENLTKILNSRKTQFDTGYYEKIRLEKESIAKKEKSLSKAKKGDLQKTLYLRSEAAEYLEISISEIDKIIKKGDIKYVIQNNVMYIPKASIVNYANGGNNLDNDFYLLNQAAYILNKSTKDIDNMISSGKLDYIVKQDVVYITKEEIIKHLKESKND